MIATWLDPKLDPVAQSFDQPQAFMQIHNIHAFMNSKVFGL